MKFDKLNAIKFGIAGGIITSVWVFLTGLSMLIIPEYLPSLANLFNQIYNILGFQANISTLLFISITSFIDGFFLTWFFAWIYNRLLK